MAKTVTWTKVSRLYTKNRISTPKLNDQCTNSFIKRIAWFTFPGSEFATYSKSKAKSEIGLEGSLHCRFGLTVTSYDDRTKLVSLSMELNISIDVSVLSSN